MNTSPGRSLKGTDIASRYVSALFKLRRSEHGLHEDLQAYHAPSECGDLVFGRTEKERVGLKRHYRKLANMNKKNFDKAIRDRVSPKCAYNMEI